jgi:hypothetical protein
MNISKITVTPAKAGVQGHKLRPCMKPWIPAFAGMTGVKKFSNSFNTPTTLHRLKTDKRTEKK